MNEILHVNLGEIKWFNSQRDIDNLFKDDPNDYDWKCFKVIYGFRDFKDILSDLNWFRVIECVLKSAMGSLFVVYSDLRFVSSYLEWFQLSHLYLFVLI